MSTIIPSTPGELRKLPRAERQAILAAAAAIAETAYRDDENLRGFEAFHEEEADDEESDAGESGLTVERLHSLEY